jgi:hypothetical protein
MNSPGVVEVPIRIVGLTCLTTVSRLMMPEAARACCRAAMSGQRPAARGSTSTGVLAQPETSPADRA